ncbi:hypothetical protein ACTRW9_05325 [Nitrospina sp. 32_T5]|uniref:hypothetical protein n=2 Tax=unclassified Nitrospina TaxID=2638683 RepID=UPI003FBE76E7
MLTCQSVSARGWCSGWMGAILLGMVILGGAVLQPVPALSANVYEEVAQRDSDMEVTDASKEAQEKLDGATSGITGVFQDIKNFFVDTWTGFDNWMKALFGFDRGEGSEAFFGTIIYAFLILVFLFVGKFIYNIFSGLFKYRGGRSGER